MMVLAELRLCLQTGQRVGGDEERRMAIRTWKHPVAGLTRHGDASENRCHTDIDNGPIGLLGLFAG